MNLFTLAPGIPFLDALAAWWLARSDDPVRQADGLILLPTRRAARALTESFLRVAGGRPLLLPRIAALGALDEGPLALHGALGLPPAMDEAERLAALSRLILALNGAHGAPTTIDRAWPLAAELARLLDEAHRAGVDLAAALPGLAGVDFAQHWADTVTFLTIVTKAWPGWLASHDRLDRADLAVRLLRAQAAAWAESPPAMPVVVAGTAGGTRAIAELMRVVAHLDQGAVVLPGLDLAMPGPVWDALDDGHPQAGLRTLLHDMQATRGDVRPLPTALATLAPGRDATIWRALLPADALATWREPFKPALDGLYRLQPEDQQEEAVAIALVLRQALEVPGARAAFATPDRALAARVAAELARFGIVADDSAGEPLAETPPGAFLRLLAQAVAEDLPPVLLLSLLKHPLAALGLKPADCRGLARRLERRGLRGPAPPRGIAGLRARLPDDDAALADLVDRLEAALAPLHRLAQQEPADPRQALLALIEAAEAVAHTPERPGAGCLWALEEGEALAEHLAGLAAALPILPPQPLRVLPGLLDASLHGATVRSRRALRGRDGTEHPRVAILGLLEARLQSFDVLVLGSLAEAVWPPAADPGPWMSRPMRRAAGLDSPETGIGEMAHDFATLACAAPAVVLSCPRRRDGAPTVPARWLVRLEAFLRGLGAALPISPAAGWARQLDQPAGPPQPVAPPEPRPGFDARPRAVSVTDVETWIRDPYGLYARRILRLRKLDELEEAAEASDFGTLVHAAIDAWLPTLPATYPPDATARLGAAMETELARAPVRPALAAWWRPRLHRIAAWVAETEAERRTTRHGALAGTEARGEWTVTTQGAPFLLTARADRLERLPDGGIAILDYKTGKPPGGKQVESGHAPQLPLEAAMAAAGAFGPAAQGTASELTYWHLTGAAKPGEATTLCKADPAQVAALATRAHQALQSLIERFDDPAEPYRSCPDPAIKPRYNDYEHLARLREWSAAREEEGDAGPE